MPHRKPPAVSPAPYALPPGTPALQTRPWAGRALLVVAATLAGIGGTAGYVLGRTGDAARSAAIDAPAATAPLDVAAARTLAGGPLQELLSRSHSYLDLVAAGCGDEGLWDGVDRMLRSVLADADHEDAALVAALHGTLSRVAPPTAIDRMLPLLELRMREVERQAHRRR